MSSNCMIAVHPFLVLVFDQLGFGEKKILAATLWIFFSFFSFCSQKEQTHNSALDYATLRHLVKTTAMVYSDRSHAFYINTE